MAKMLQNGKMTKQLKLTEKARMAELPEHKKWQDCLKMEKMSKLYGINLLAKLEIGQKFPYNAPKNDRYLPINGESCQKLPDQAIFLPVFGHFGHFCQSLSFALLVTFWPFPGNVCTFEAFFAIFRQFFAISIKSGNFVSFF